MQSLVSDHREEGTFVTSKSARKATLSRYAGAEVSRKPDAVGDFTRITARSFTEFLILYLCPWRWATLGLRRKIGEFKCPNVATYPLWSVRPIPVCHDDFNVDACINRRTVRLQAEIPRRLCGITPSNERL